MKYFIASDIHGSAFYCNKMLEALKNEKADYLVLLGDILYHGPRNDLPKDYNPKKVIELLNSLTTKIICVRGNCDSEVDQMVLNFPLLATYGVIENNNHLIYLTHGHVYNKDNLPPIKENDVVLFGHTHVPEFIKQNGIYFINPGSVSIPKNNSYNGYIILENGKFIFKDLDMNIINIKELDD